MVITESSHNINKAKKLGDEANSASVNRRKFRIPLLWGTSSVLMMGVPVFIFWLSATNATSSLALLILNSIELMGIAIVSLMILIPCTLTLYDALRLDEDLSLADLSMCTIHSDRKAFDCCGVCGKPFCIECLCPTQNKIWRGIRNDFGFKGVVCRVCARQRCLAIAITILAAFIVLFLTITSVVYFLPIASRSFGFIVIALIGVCLALMVADIARRSKKDQSWNLEGTPEEVDNLINQRSSALNQPHGKSKLKAMAIVLIVVIIMGVPFAVLGGIGVMALQSYQIDTSPPTDWQLIAADNASSTLESWQRVDIYIGETSSAMFFRAEWHASIPECLNEINESISVSYAVRYVDLCIEWCGEECNISLGHESSYYGPWTAPIFRVIYSTFDALYQVVGVVSADIIAKAPRIADTIIQSIQGGTRYWSNAEARDAFAVNYNDSLDITADGYLTEWVSIPNITLGFSPSETTENFIAIKAATFFITPQGCGVTMTLNQPIIDILELHPDLQRHARFEYTLGKDPNYYQAEFFLLDLSSEAYIWNYPPYDNPPVSLSSDQWGLGASFEAYYLAAQIPGLSPDEIVPNFLSISASISWEWQLIQIT
jgi:hypothetical protein